MYYPIKFKPLYKSIIWGGRNLEKFGKSLPEGKVAESWEISAHPDGMSVIANGMFSDMTLIDVIKEHKRNIIGSKLPEKDLMKFPLLIKLIDANDRLSVQVHPDDEYAFINENGEYGKNELWYVVDAKPGAKLVYDLKPGVTKDTFKKAVEEGNIDSCLKYLNVKGGDCLNIPAGLVHAIGEGIVICEVQQNSNTTYRVYDYDRITDGKKRELHINKALDVIDFSHSRKNEFQPGLLVTRSHYNRKFLGANRYFCVEHIESKRFYTDNTDTERFHTYTLLKGSASINDVSLSMGDSVLIPAAMGEYVIEGSFEAIKSYVPDIEKNVMNVLLSEGYTKKTIEEAVF